MSKYLFFCVYDFSYSELSNIGYKGNNKQWNNYQNVK